MVTVDTGTETYEAIAAIPPREDRDRPFARIIAQEPGYGEYQTKTGRIIPVVVLHRVDLDPDRIKHLGDELVEVHDWLRTELADLRRQVNDLVEGRVDSVEVGRTAPDPAAELRSHCLNFCQAPHVHHSGEDIGAFPVLCERFPALTPVLRKLTEEHTVVAEVRDRIKGLVTDFVPGQGDPHQLRDDLERLAAQLETHFDVEENHLFTALNALGPASGRD